MAVAVVDVRFRLLVDLIRHLLAVCEIVGVLVGLGMLEGLGTLCQRRRAPCSETPLHKWNLAVDGVAIKCTR